MSADREKRPAPPPGQIGDEREDIERVLADDCLDEEGGAASEDSGVSFLDRFLPPRTLSGR